MIFHIFVVSQLIFKQKIGLLHGHLAQEFMCSGAFKLNAEVASVTCWVDPKGELLY